MWLGYTIHDGTSTALSMEWRKQDHMAAQITVFRPNAAINSVSMVGSVAEGTRQAISQTISSVSPSQAPALRLHYASVSGTTNSIGTSSRTVTLSPSTGWTVEDGVGSSTATNELYFAYKTESSGTTFSSQSISVADGGAQGASLVVLDIR